MAPIVELINVTKHYQRGGESVKALDRISFSIAAGEAIALVGPSGCGKTTTLNLIAGVDFPDSGQITIDGIALASARERERTLLRRTRIGFVFQAFHLMPHLTVEENVALPLALDGRHDPKRVQDLLERVGLGHRLHHYPSELSGGEQQRTAIARALVHRPAVLLADEPTGNLDSHAGEAVLQLMDELRHDEQTALLLVTHDESIAARTDRILHIRDGRIESIAQTFVSES